MRFLPVFALVAAVAGCSSEEPPPKPEPIPETPPDLVVTLSSPAGTAYTREPLTAEVVVAEGQAEKVELLAGDQVIATASTAPYTFTWDTTLSAEGPYTLWARATRSGKVFPSNHRLVVVDRTAPQLVSHTPAAGTFVEGHTATVTLTFSEPLLLSSVEASRFNVGYTPAVQAQLSEDGRTLTLQSAADLASPGTLRVAASNSGLTDLAGNPVGLLDTSSAWLVPAWSPRYPATEVYGGRTAASAPVLALDAQGTPYVAWAEQEPGSTLPDRVVSVRRWNGTSWESLGGRLNRNNLYLHSGPSLAIDSNGAPIVAFIEWDDSGNDAMAWVYRWDGGKWVNLGGPIHAVVAANSYVHDVALTVSGTTPTLAWAEPNGQRLREVFVRQWNGTSWQALGGAVSLPGEDAESGFDMHSLRLVTDAAGAPVLAWSATQSGKSAIRVAHYESGTWRRLGAPLSVSVGGRPKQPALVVTAQGTVYVTWAEDEPSDYRIYAAHWTGEKWEQLGDVVSEELDNHASHPSIALRGGTPVVAWSGWPVDTGGIRVHVRGFDERSGQWTPWAKRVSAFPDNTVESNYQRDPWLVIDSTGNLLVAFTEGGAAGEGSVHFYRPE
ncbi:Ig-like domain-containing protein [Pyxidicoccus sp. 3LG]